LALRFPGSPGPLDLAEKFGARRVPESAIVLYLFGMRIHEPIFPEGLALYIVWLSDWNGRRSLLATSEIGVARLAWPSLVEAHPDKNITLQQGARVILRHPE
jgi:hypothetical protein